MPLRLDIKRKLSKKSDRVKSVDFHPTEPWLLAALYNGNVYIWNHETQVLVKTFEVTEQPVRCGKFVARKNWIAVGADDMHIRVFNYNTQEKITAFEAHSDYIRCLAVHPTLPYILSSSDDCLIKLWDWDRGWKNVQIFEGHTHYVMYVAINPKDTNTFASASLDRTIKVWSLGSNVANFTLEGHEKGVNCVDYYHGGEKPFVVSGGDDHLVKVWDYQNKSCVQTLDGHTQNVSFVCYHPELPLIVSGSEDCTVRLWHANTYRLEGTLNYSFERAWTISYLRGSNDLALGYDEGTIVIKLGREEPAVSMDASGKIIWARHNEIQTANIKTGGEEEVADGERLSLPVKDLGSCEVYPQTLQHNPNGRFVVVSGDGEYIIYTALAWRNKSFGSALEFVWGADANEYAVRENSSKVKLFKNFKDKTTIKPNFSAEGIFGGALLGIRSSTFVCLYNWDSGAMIRRIDVIPKNIYWNENGELLAIICESAFYILRYNSDAVTAAAITAEGVEAAFDVISEVQDSCKTACWIGDCFIFTTASNRLSYLIGGQISTVAHFEKTLYLLGYIQKNNRLYLADKDLNIVSYNLSLSVLEYQTAILREDLEAAQDILPRIPPEERNKISRFLEAHNLMDLALEIATDPEHKFDLAMQLHRLDAAFEIASESSSDAKWKQLGDLALAEWKLDLAEECLTRAKDFSGLLMIHTAISNRDGIRALAVSSAADGKYNISFICYFLLGEVDQCIDILQKTNRIPEATFMARTYAPSQISTNVQLWRKSLSQTHKKLADALADPQEYPNLFPDYFEALQKEEQSMEAHENHRKPDLGGATNLNNLRELHSPMARLVVEDDSSQVDATSEHYSLDVNTTGTGSVRADDLDDLDDLGIDQDDHANSGSNNGENNEENGGGNDDDDDDLDELLNS